MAELLIVAVVAVLLALGIALYAAGLALNRLFVGNRTGIAATALLVIPVGVGPVVLWHVLDGRIPTDSILAPLKIGAMCLYLAGCVAFIESLSLFSRGYSLRILIDLLGRQGQADLLDLKAGYGNGLGLDGMLAKRVTTLARFRLIRFNTGRKGFLTGPGRICAQAVASWRRLLKLDKSP